METIKKHYELIAESNLLQLILAVGVLIVGCVIYILRKRKLHKQLVRNNKAHLQRDEFNYPEFPVLTTEDSDLLSDEQNKKYKEYQDKHSNIQKEYEAEKKRLELNR